MKNTKYTSNKTITKEQALVHKLIKNTIGNLGALIWNGVIIQYVILKILSILLL